MLLAPRLDTATETITDLLKFDLVFSRRVVLMSLFLVAVGPLVWGRRDGSFFQLFCGLTIIF